MRKRIYSILLAIALLATIIPITVLAEDPHTHIVNGETVTFEAWTSDNSLPTDEGNYYLTKNVKISETWTVANNTKINLCLNGFNIVREGGNCITIKEYAALTIYDCSDKTHHFDVDSTGLWKLNEDSGSKSVTGGCIMGINPVAGQIDGIGIFINSNGTLYMYGGNIVGSTASRYGGGVNVCQNATFNMLGGTIVGNTALDGGGVCVDGVFNLHGGNIEYNKATNYGGGIYINENGRLNMNGGTITGNTAGKNGGGVHIVSNASAANPAIGGSAQIVGNTKGTALLESNLNLNSNKNVFINSDPAPTSDMSVGITLGGDNERFGGQFTTNGTTGDIQYFTSDDPNYYVSYNNGGYLEMIKGYIVTFDANGHGTAPDAVCVAPNATVSKPTDPSETGLEFGGWFLTPSGEGQWDFNTNTVTTAVTLYAKWSYSKYDITYKDKGDADFTGTHASDYPTNHTYGTATTLKDATKAGYTFGGWFTSPDCSGSAVTSLGATAYTQGITLYAKWTANTTNVTLEKQSGTGGSNSITATYDAEMPSAEMPTREGFIFNGYFDEASGGNQYYDADGTSVKNWDKDEPNAMLFAQWTQQYTVTYNGNGATSGEVVDNNKYLSGNTFTVLPGDSLVREGYTFKTWNRAADGSDYEYNPGEVQGITRNITLYAQWTKNPTPKPDPDPTPDPEPINYKITQGANSIWVVAAGESPVFRSNADFSKFSHVLLDGKELAKKHYKYESGSTLITLTPEYTATLTVGKHTIEIVSTDGSAATVFYIEETIADTNGEGFALSTATMSSLFVACNIIGLSAVFFEIKKKKKVK